MKPYPDLAGYETAREWLEELAIGALPQTLDHIERVSAMLEAAAAVVESTLYTEPDTIEARDALEELMR